MDGLLFIPPQKGRQGKKKKGGNLTIKIKKPYFKQTVNRPCLHLIQVQRKYIDF